ncbi:MAG: hypothetical protein V1708_01635 [Candidatus Micrarchaeota archaeon]
MDLKEYRQKARKPEESEENHEIGRLVEHEKTLIAYLSKQIAARVAAGNIQRKALEAAMKNSMGKIPPFRTFHADEHRIPPGLYQKLAQKVGGQQEARQLLTEASRVLTDLSWAHQEKYAQDLEREHGPSFHVAHVFTHTIATFNTILTGLATQ